MNRIKWAAALSLLLLLMYAGYRGRQQAWLEASLHEITLLSNQVQQQLDQAATPAAASASAALVEQLKLRLARFDAEYPGRELTPADDLDLRLSRATLANAEHRFVDAVATVTGADEKRAEGTAIPADRRARVFQVRGNAYYALQQWQNALATYRQLVALQPARLRTLTRLAECQAALGRTNDAASTYTRLAQTHTQQGWTLLREGKTDAAVRRFGQAVDVQTRLVDQLGQRDMIAFLMLSRNSLGDALLLQGKAAAATEEYRKAIALESRSPTIQPGDAKPTKALLLSHENLGNALLVQRQFPAAITAYEQALAASQGLTNAAAETDVIGQVAGIHNNEANAWLEQGKPDPALTNYAVAIAMRTGLLARDGGDELRQELAMSYNNRGVAHRSQDQTEAALSDFDKAIEILKPLAQREDRSAGVRPSPAAAAGLVQLVVEFAYTERAMDVLTRARLREQPGHNEPAVALATALKNRGYTRQVQARPDAATTDFKQAVEIYSRLVEQGGQKDLAVQFAKSLSALAWVLATSPDDSVRNGGQARELALKACELTGWRAPAALETLAAACAETGSFAEAVKWQQSALRLTPGTPNPELRSRLEQYQSGRPFRSPVKQ